jgi:ABC-2 type transport system permease protein
MTRPRPGSLLWFLAHDLRLSIRAFEAQFRGLSRVRVVAIIFGAVALTHALAWPAAWRLQLAVQDPGGRGRVETWAAAGVVVSLSMILAQAMVSAMRALYARADFELIFAAPVSPAVVLGSRALAIAFEGAATAALVLLPIANIASLLDRPAWLAIYPWLLAAALASAGLGLVIAMAFFVVLGPQRARLYLQVSATLVGASFVLAAQAFSLLPPSLRSTISAAVFDPTPGSMLDHRGALWLPVRAAIGDPVALVIWLLCGFIAFIAAVVSCSGRVAFIVASAGGDSANVGANGEIRSFRGGVGPSLRRKERKLILRDPWLLSQILLQIIYVLPISIALWRRGGVTGSVEVAIPPSIVVIAAQLSGSLAWVMISGEDAPELLASAPVSRKALDLHKLGAIALPIGLFLALPILAVGYFSLKGAIVAAGFAAGAGASTALLNFWRQAPAKRTMVLRRHSQSRLVAIFELFITLIWAVACAVTVMTSWIGVVTLAPAILVAWFARPRDRVAKRDTLLMLKRRGAKSPERLQPDDKSRVSAWGPFATFGLALVAAVSGQIPALAVLSWWHDSGLSIAKLQNMASSGVAVTTLLCVSTPVQVGLLFWFARLRGSSALEYLALTPPRKRDLVTLTLSGVALLAVGDGVSWLLGKSVVTSFQSDIFRSAASAGALLWLWLAVIIAAPIGEEILFRGFLFRGWQRSQNNAWAAIGLTAVLWAIVHVQYNPLVIGEILLIGLGLGWVRWRTGSTISTIVLHSILNTIGMAETFIQLRG